MPMKLAALARDDEGQNIVEFALLLPLLMYILMGIIQFGFIFAAYLTLNNAVREGARWGSIYIYDNNQTLAQNDDAREDGIVSRMIASRGILSMAALGSSTPNFSTNGNGAIASSASCPSSTGTTWLSGTYYGTAANPDVSICYSYLTGSVTPSNARRGEYLDVETWYHQQVFIPLLDQFLPNDPVKGAQWIRIPARITVVIN